MRYPTLAVGLLAALPAAAQDKPVLTVYTYDSFVTDYGPGPQIEQAFERICECDLEFVGTGDGAEMLSRLRLEGDRTEADIALGLDTNLIAAARNSGLFEAPDIDLPEFDMPIDWRSDVYIPYDWSYFAFVYDTDELSDPPTSFAALAESDISVVIEDPRSSTPGLGLLLWVKRAKGDEAPAIWEALSDNIVTVTRSWSEAYGLFLDGEAEMVLSYTTSPAYHAIAEDDATIAAAPFEEGHYMQIEVAAKLASSENSDLADRFLQFMVSDTFQEIIPTTNWMYPAKLPKAGLPEKFGGLFEPAQPLLYAAEDAAALRDPALREWREALSK